MIPAEAQHALSNNARRHFLGAERFDPEREWDRCRELGVTVLILGSPQYPALLASISDPPLALYVLGDPGFAQDPAALPALAFVGTRRPTPYGRRIARFLAAEAARAGIAVVSGLARGIDTESHQAALEAGGKTWAVLGSGLDRPYPPENVALLRKIAASGGAVVSEIPLSGPPIPANFPRRNRIISGLACATVVVEGGMTSGALITAKEAAHQGRPVFAVPGPADSPMSDGPIHLLRQGASPAAGLEDLLQGLPESCSVRQRIRQEYRTRPTFDEKKILELMGAEPVHLEDLVRCTGWEVERLLGLLAEMEVKSLIDSHSGQLYAKH